MNSATLSLFSHLCFNASRTRARRLATILPTHLHFSRQSCTFAGKRPRCFVRQHSMTLRQYSIKSKQNEPEVENGRDLRENIYTLPNAFTVSRILACPILGWSIVQGKFGLATGILVYAGASDWLDGYLARRYKMRSVIGTILDPAADKTLMTTLVISLAMRNLLPISLAAIILGRDVLLSLSAFYIRYKTLPPPKTLTRYWDFSIPSAEVHPTGISKVNTALQLLLMGVTTTSPLISVDISLVLYALQWTVAGTTVLSGMSYLFSKDAVRVIRFKKRV